jgi:uncharacterized protein involved in outer membrane biogenesis
MRWKWVLIGIVGLLLVVVGVGYLVVTNYDVNRLKPQLAQVVKEHTGREVVFGGDIDVKPGLVPAFVVENVSFQNAPWGSRPELARVKRLEVQVALWPLLRKEIVLQRLLLVQPDILIETDQAGQSNLRLSTRVTEPSTAPGQAPSQGEITLPQLLINQIRLEQGRLTYKNGQTGTTHVVDLQKLLVTGSEPGEPVKIALQGAYNTQPFEVEGTVGALAALSTPGTPWPVTIRATGGGATVMVDGTIQDVLHGRGLAMHVTAQGTSIAALLKLVDVNNVPELGPFQVSFTLADPNGTLAVQQLQVALPNLALRGTGEVRLAGPRPQFTASLASEKMDLRPLLAVAEKRQPPGTNTPAAQRDRLFSQTPLSLPGLQHADATIELRAKQLLTPRLALDDLAVHLVLQDGLLTVKPVQARMGGGELAGEVKLQPAGREVQVALAIKAHKVDVGHMVRELQVTDVFEGKLDATVDVRGKGSSIAAIMAGLHGQTALMLGKGRLDNAYIELIGADLGASLFRLVNPLKQEQPVTEVNCLVSRFDIQNGIARSTALVFDTRNMIVVGEGQINLKTEALDLSLKPAPKEGPGVSGIGKIGLSLSELAKPLKLGGTLARPSLRVDATQAALAVGKSLGGAVLFGPAGIAASLLSGSSAGNENACLTALEAGKSGVTSPRTGPLDDVKDILEKVPKGLGGDLKKLFGK